MSLFCFKYHWWTRENWIVPYSNKTPDWNMYSGWTSFPLSLHYMKGVFYNFFTLVFEVKVTILTECWEMFNLESVNERYLRVLQLSLVAHHFCMRWLKTSQTIKYISFKNRHIFRIPAIFLGHKKAEYFRWCYQVQKYLIRERRFKRYHFMPIVLADANKNSVCWRKLFHIGLVLIKNSL